MINIAPRKAVLCLIFNINVHFYLEEHYFVYKRESVNANNDPKSNLICRRPCHERELSTFPIENSHKMKYIIKIIIILLDELMI